MKVLILTNNPERASFRQRIETYLDAMRQRGIQPVVQVLNPSLFKRIRQYRQADRYEVVLLHKKCLNLLEGLFFRPQKARVLFNYDDAVMFSDRGIATPTHTARFRRSLSKADVVLVAGSFLADQARPYHSHVVVLPIGLNTRIYQADKPQKEDNRIRLVWIGSKATLPYITELTPVMQSLAEKYPALVLRLICDDFMDMEGVCIEKIPWTPQARSGCIGDCDIGLAPLPDTPFTRGKCSFKVLEYSASGIPVVASPIGTNSEYVQEGVTGFLADTPRQWREKLSLLIENPSRRAEMGRRGRQYAQNYDVSVIGKKFCDLLLEMANS